MCYFMVLSYALIRYGEAIEYIKQENKKPTDVGICYIISTRIELYFLVHVLY
jgi:hypothetical protein